MNNIQKTENTTFYTHKTKINFKNNNIKTSNDNPIELKKDEFSKITLNENRTKENEDKKKMAIGIALGVPIVGLLIIGLTKKSPKNTLTSLVNTKNDITKYQE